MLRGKKEKKKKRRNGRHPRDTPMHPSAIRQDRIDQLHYKMIFTPRPLSPARCKNFSPGDDISRRHPSSVARKSQEP